MAESGNPQGVMLIYFSNGLRRQCLNKEIVMTPQGYITCRLRYLIKGTIFESA